MNKKFSRRSFLNRCVVAGTTSSIAPMAILGGSGATAFSGPNVSLKKSEPIDIGTRLELFVDDYIIQKLTGKASLHLHKPVPREVVFTADRPWEGNTSLVYATFFQDGDLYRMYYRGSGMQQPNDSGSFAGEYTCYAYSHDGVDWIRPELGLIEFDGSKENNIIHDGVARHNFAPFKDTNPDCAEDAGYKAIGGHTRTGGLYAFKSSDGIQWKLMSDTPVFVSDWEKRSGWGQPWFDSHNLAFWDNLRNRYVLYFRHFCRDGRYRDIMACTSPDMLSWSEAEYLEYPGAPGEHLYTNSIMAYQRAPHIFIGFPNRMHSLTSQWEPRFMASRDGRTFHRWPDAIIPLDAPQDRDGNRSNGVWWGLLQLPDSDREYSIYAHEAYYAGEASRLRRFTYRVDGFVSVRAPAEGGDIETRLITSSGNQLVVNFVTKERHLNYEGGSLQVEILDDGGWPVEGFSLSECNIMRGDAIDHTVTWKSGNHVGTLAGKPIRFRFHLKYADLFSFRVI